MIKDTSGPAFPCDLAMYDQEVVDAYSGMTLRDYFAAKAIQADMAAGVHEDDFPATAARGYKMADEMLKARGA
jgi:hypothetical protein